MARHRMTKPYANKHLSTKLSIQRLQVKEIVVNKMPMKDYILLVLGERHPYPMKLKEIFKGMLAKGYKTIYKRPSNIVRVSMYRLLDQEGLVTTLDDGKFILTDYGVTKAKETWCKHELQPNFNDQWLNPQLASLAAEQAKDPLHDALLDANAPDTVLKWFNDGMRTQWLCEWIDQRWKIATFQTGGI
jgi:hypothetical protein